MPKFTRRASIIRKRLEYLGRVQAPDRESAESAAMIEFNLTDELVLEKVD
jgi:hypothetical protein